MNSKIYTQLRFLFINLSATYFIECKMKKILTVTLTYFFFNSISYACPELKKTETLQEISHNQFHALLILSSRLQHCTIRTEKTLGQTVIKKTWQVSKGVLESAVEYKTHTETQVYSEQQDIISRTNEIDIEYNVKSQKILNEFKDIKNIFSKENIEKCSMP